MENQIVANDEISLKELIQKVGQLFQYIKKKWFFICLVATITGILGFLYASLSHKKYQANLSFVLEESKTGGGGLASLAGQFGFDIGAASNGGGLFFGENLLLFLKSATLTKTVLLTTYDSATKLSLADKYAETYNLKKEWLENPKIGKEVSFWNLTAPDRLKDSLLSVITQIIIKKELAIDRPEKKASFISVSATMEDELLAKLFCDRIVTKAVEIYLQSKTKRLKTNVDKLQARVDSIGAVLNNVTYTNSYQQEKILDVNPGARTVTVKAELSGRDKMMLMTIYGEVIKNLEIAKVQLNQETPTIQMVDMPSLPLKTLKKGTILFTSIGLFVGFILTIGLLIGKRIIGKSLQ